MELASIELQHSSSPAISTPATTFADRSKGAGKYYCSDHFDRHASEGELSDLWRLTNGASREWTWHSTKGNGFRIDHAFGNSAFVAKTAPICTYDHRARETGLTDHSAVVIRLGEVTEERSV